uniref:C-type lectin domain family 3, member Bb n=1 Tax=Astyanax mexicanus TaxID=7994 RepID=A0A8B9HGB4_ASTMX
RTHISEFLLLAFNKIDICPLPRTVITLWAHHGFYGDPCKKNTTASGNGEATELCLRGKKIQGKCLLADPQQKSYHTASEDCIAKGGTLSAPLSGLENEQLTQYVRESLGPDTRVWLGLNDMRSEGAWVDLAGTAVTYRNWEASSRPPQPDGGTAENCAALSASAGGKWSDESCRLERASVCEFKIV